MCFAKLAMQFISSQLAWILAWILMDVGNQGVLRYPIPWPTRKCMWWREMGRSRILLSLVVRNLRDLKLSIWKWKSWSFDFSFQVDSLARKHRWQPPDNKMMTDQNAIPSLRMHFTRLNRSWSIIVCIIVCHSTWWLDSFYNSFYPAETFKSYPFIFVNFQAMSHVCSSSRKWSLTTSPSASRTCARCELGKKKCLKRLWTCLFKPYQTFIFVYQFTKLFGMVKRFE